MFIAKCECPGRIEWCLALAALASFCMIGVAPDANAQSDRAMQLIGELRDRNPNKRSKAESALAKMGSSATEPLIAALKDPDPATRRAVASVLGKIGDPRVVEPLIGVLKDPTSGAQVAAAVALGATSDARAVEPLIAALKDPDRGLRGGAAVALGKIREPRAIDSLIGALKDAEAAVRGGAVQALSDIGETATEPLITALRDPDPHVRQGTARALGYIRSPRAVSVLIGAWAAGDPDVIAGASPFFIARGEPGSEDTLIRALNTNGDPLTAMCFLNAGNQKLAEAARQWGTARGAQSLTISIAPGGSVAFAQWGSARSDIEAKVAQTQTQTAMPSPQAEAPSASTPVPEPREASSSGKSVKPLTNDDIKQMAAGGLNDDTIALAIKTRTCDFDTSVAALIDLKKAGVSERIIELMVGAPRPAPRNTDIPPGAPPTEQPARAIATDRPTVQTAGVNGEEISLVLIDMDSKKPVSAARIALAPAKERKYQKDQGIDEDSFTIDTSLTGLSDEHGEVHIQNVHPGEYVVIQILSGNARPELEGRVVTWGRTPANAQFHLSLGAALVSHGAVAIVDGALVVTNGYMEVDGLGIRTTATGRLLTVSVPGRGSAPIRIEIPNPAKSTPAR